MAVRKIIQIGNPAIKKKNKEIKDFLSNKFKKLLKDLKDTIKKTNS